MRFNVCHIISIFIMLAISLSFTTRAAEWSASTDDGVRFETADGKFKAKLGGRLQFDGAKFDDDKTPLKDDWIVRRARLSLRADIFSDWRVSLQYDLADREERVHSLWLRYTGFKKNHITVGQFQEPFGLEDATSSNTIIFMERSLVNTLVPGTNVGFSLHRWAKQWSLNTGAFWETYIEDSDPFSAREGYGLSGRLTFAPIIQSHNVLHLGASVSYRVPDESKRTRFRTQLETDVSEERLISTGRIRNVNTFYSAGLEGLVLAGRFTLQGEYIRTTVYRSSDRDDETFAGGYLLASVFLTQDRRRYSSRSGAFGGVKPKNGSVWELAVRSSYLDLNSSTGNVTRGKQVNLSWGINWYLHQRLRFMLNYIQVNTDKEAGDDDPNIWQLRAQVAI